MGDIIPFIARVRDAGDWTAAERARLDALVDQFARAGVRVEVVYGVTEDGDPWCVVKDENEDVLVHVAKIGGVFVVHQAADDSLAQAGDLPAALGQQLAAMDAAHDRVVPFAASGRQLQTLIALVVATAFVYDHRESQGLIALDVTVEPPADEAHAMAAAAASAPVVEPDPKSDRELAPRLAAAGDASHAPAEHAVVMAADTTAPTTAPAAHDSLAVADEAREVRSAPPAPPPQPPVVNTEPTAPTAHAQVHEIVGSDRGEVLAGGHGVDLIRGGAGADTLSGGGAPTGQFDTLSGGAGDDRIEVTSQVVAIGGSGADTFVIAAPKVMGDPGTFLGAIVDFHAFEGDRLVNVHGGAVTVVRPPETFTTLARPLQPPGWTPDNSATVFVDVNGDGRPDGYLLFGRGPGTPDGEAPAPTDHPDHTATTDQDIAASIVAQGHGFPPPVIG